MLVRRRLPEGVDGLAALHGLVADHLGEDDEPDQVLVGIETDRGPWVQALIAAGYTVYRDQPAAGGPLPGTARHRRGEVRPGDAHVLAEIVRLDRAHHRPAAGDSDGRRAVKVAARAHQTMIWTRQRPVNTLRSMLREFYPAALAAFATTSPAGTRWPCSPVAPTRGAGRRLTPARVEKALRRAGRQRNLDRRAGEIVAALRAEQLPARPGAGRAPTPPACPRWSR